MLPRLNRHFSSVIVCEDSSLIVASLEQKVYRVGQNGVWHSLNKGLPSNIKLHRLQRHQRIHYACTNKGLYYLQGDEWLLSEIALPTYQIKGEQESYAATQYGLWRKEEKVWYKTEGYHSVVFDFLDTPSSLILAQENGISFYDRQQQFIHEHRLGQAVTSIIHYQNQWIGTTSLGALIYGDIEEVQSVYFEDLFIFSVITIGEHSYACTENGLYKIISLNGRISLLSVRLGCPVTDVAQNGSTLHLATLFQGIQSLEGA